MMGSSVVQKGAWEFESNSETADEMVKALTPAEEKAGPVVKLDRGKAPEQADIEARTRSEAARELGKAGGQAAAKAREEKAKEPDKEPDKAPVVKEAKSNEDKAEGEDKPEDKAPEQPGKARRDDPAVRIRQLAAEKNALAERLARQEREFAERLERLERGAKPAEPESAQAKAPDGKPSVDDFATYEEYVEALTDWKTDQKLKAVDERRTAERTQAERQAVMAKRHETFRAKVAERVAEWDGMDPRLMEAIRENPPIYELDGPENVGPWNYITEAITQSEDPTGFARYLSDHEEVVKDLILSGPWDLPMKLGRLEAKFAEKPAESPREAPRASSAPPPLRPVSPSAQPSDDITADIPFDEFLRRKRKR